jgi:hypothetical protein
MMKELLDQVMGTLDNVRSGDECRWGLISW